VAPLGTGVQVPGDVASAHDRHVPVQAVLQQTPCAQKPLAHSVPSPQTEPGALSPQEPAVQTAGVWQSASAAQLALHASAPQRNGKHELAGGVTQAPAPSQVEPGVKVVLGQLGSPHDVPCANFWHAPAAHMPFVPQLAAAWATQVLDGSGAPVGTSAQVPMAPASAHDLQAPAQAVAQQTPCAQTPEPHSRAVEQNEPMGFGPHELCSHTFGSTHWASTVQALKQRVPLHAKGAQGSEGGAAHWPVPLQVDAGV
jgi:hypothetical protein